MRTPNPGLKSRTLPTIPHCLLKFLASLFLNTYLTLQLWNINILSDVRRTQPKITKVISSWSLFIHCTDLYCMNTISSSWFSPPWKTCFFSDFTDQKRNPASFSKPEIGIKYFPLSHFFRPAKAYSCLRLTVSAIVFLNPLSTNHTVIPAPLP